MFGLDPGLTILLAFCLLTACIFEFINGFHDTANAVATVIYTHSMKPRVAVIWSGFFNFIGVYFGGIAVAIGIINLLPIALLVDNSISHNVAMILALIFTAVLWNLGTWYLGLPCSSSHTLIGSIFGVGIAYGLMPDSLDVALNWDKVKDVLLSLLISPFFGFSLTMLLVLFLKEFMKKSKLFNDPKKKKAPPFWIRNILILTCTSVSFSHGSNDGQKGVGLMMIILICLVPARFAIDHDKLPQELKKKVDNSEIIVNRIIPSQLSIEDKMSLTIVKECIDSLQYDLNGVVAFNDLKRAQHLNIRKNILILAKESSKVLTQDAFEPMLRSISKKEKKVLSSKISGIKSYTEYAPIWIIFMISISLGLGTMIGWKRIVITIGEKIGKEHLTYAQGASAELVAASTIGVSSLLGLPVSTTHVLSSGIAGSMVAKGGFKNLRMKTVRNIMLAWLITLPATILLSGCLFLLMRWLFEFFA